MALGKAISIIGGFTALSRILGFLRDILIAAYLGTSPLADAFFTAFKLPNFFRRLFAEGTLNAAFVPIYTQIYTSQTIEKAQRTAEEVFSVLLITLIFFVVFFEIFMDHILPLIAPGFIDTPLRLEYGIVLGRLMFPYILFISLGAFISSILNSHGRFSAAASAPILLNIFAILALIFYHNYFQTPAHALAISVLGAGIAQFLWVLTAARRAGIKLYLRRPSLTPSVKKLLKTMIPGLIGTGIVQINLLVDIIIASLLPVGSVSYLYYADRLNQLPLSIIGIALSTALLPILSKKLHEKLFDEAYDLQNKVLEISLFLTLPATIALMIFSEPILSVLFERASFSHLQIQKTAYALSAFALGLPGYILIKIFSTCFFARHDIKTPVKINLICLFLNIILSLILMKFLFHVGVALATAITAWINALCLGILLFKNEHFKIDFLLKRKIPKIIFSSIILGLFLEYCNRVWPYHTSKIYQLGVFIISILSGLILYIFISFYLKIFTYKSLKKILKV